MLSKINKLTIKVFVLVWNYGYIYLSVHSFSVKLFILFENLSKKLKLKEREASNFYNNF